MAFENCKKIQFKSIKKELDRKIRKQKMTLWEREMMLQKFQVSMISTASQR